MKDFRIGLLIFCLGVMTGSAVQKKPDEAGWSLQKCDTRPASPVKEEPLIPVHQGREQIFPGPGWPRPFVAHSGTVLGLGKGRFGFACA